jgi:sulfopropanediol 3-dehydrogenase
MAHMVKQGKIQETQHSSGIMEAVRSIIQDVTERGDSAVRDYSAKFDRWNKVVFV